MPDVNPTYYSIPGLKGNADLLRKKQEQFALWVNATSVARSKFKRDFEIAEGNGKQWAPKDRASVEISGRPALEFNKVLPQIELVAGLQRTSKVDFVALPRGLEDRRLGEIATSTLKATEDFSRLERVKGKVFDDGTICGLGVFKVIHTLDDPDDLVWGDVSGYRINPLCYIWDPWAVDPDLQDGSFMGDAYWMAIDDFKATWPKHAHLAKPGEWMGKFREYFGDSSQFGTSEQLLPELFDAERGRIRVLNLWHKEPKKIALLINEKTGQVKDLKDEQEGLKIIEDIRRQVGREAVAPLQVIRTDTYSEVVSPMGPMQDPQTGLPMQYADSVSAQARVDQLADQMGLEATDGMKVIKRQARVPYSCTLTWWDIIESNVTPYQDRKYPYIPYISRRFSDDPDSIMGIVRNLWDPIGEYNKRYSNLLAHQNSSSHSGWFNKKAGGANSKELELVGSKPGVVVEYVAMRPEQIKPVELSQGHFAMLQTSEANILQISGVNADLVGIRQPAPSVVSGRAINARQQSGSTILQPRFHSWEETQLDLASMLLSRIQQFYPAEKIKRIIGVAELNGPLMDTGLPMFNDPQTGQPMSEDQIILMLAELRNSQFDLALRLNLSNPTERQAQFEQGLQMAGIVAASGHPVGPNTIQALIDLADLPTRVAEGLKRDAAAMMNPQLAQMQSQALNKNSGSKPSGPTGVNTSA